MMINFPNYSCQKKIARTINTVCLSISRLCKKLITLDMVHFDQILHTYAYQHCLTIGMCNSLFLMGEALLSISPAGHGESVKIFKTFEPHNIFL